MNTSNLSTVRLFNAPFDISYQHTRWFSTRQEQEAYFAQSLVAKETLSKAQFIKINTGQVKVPFSRESILDCNYVRFNNIEKSYFAFVTSLDYINPNTTMINFEIDVMQTYMFDMQVKQSFVEREHCDPNSVNTVPESFDLGFEYDIKDTLKSNILSKYTSLLLIGTTERLKGDPVGENQNLMSGSPSSLFYYLYPIAYQSDYAGLRVTRINGKPITPQFTEILNFIQNEENSNKVVSMTMLPKIPFTSSTSLSQFHYDISSTYLQVVCEDRLARIKGHAIEPFRTLLYPNLETKLKSLGNITEKKLLYYPYSFATLVDNNGNQLDILPQYLSGNDVEVTGRVATDARFRATYTVERYRGNSSTTLENTLINNVPYDIPIINDFSATYLQGNRNSMITGAIGGVVTGAVSTVGGMALLATGNPLGAVGVGGGIVSIGRTIGGGLAKHNDIKNVPDSISRQASSSILNIASDLFLPQLLVKQISNEKIDIIQNYLKAYGWATNKTKVPNIRTRQHFNYIQTIGCNVIGQIPKASLDTIKNNFDKGITLWHTNDMFNYNLQNGAR